MSATEIIPATTTAGIFSKIVGYFSIFVFANVTFPPNILSNKKVDSTNSKIKVNNNAPTMPPSKKNNASFLPAPAATTPVPGQYPLTAKPNPNINPPIKTPVYADLIFICSVSTTPKLNKIKRIRLLNPIANKRTFIR